MTSAEMDEAAYYGDFDKLESLREQGVHPTPKAMSLATFRGYFGVVQWLQRYFPDCRSKWSVSHAARNGELRCLLAVYEPGCEIGSTKNTFGLTRLRYFTDCYTFLILMGVTEVSHNNDVNQNTQDTLVTLDTLFAQVDRVPLCEPRMNLNITG